MSTEPTWDNFIYPQQKSICYVMSSVFLLYLSSLILLILFWKYVQRRVLFVSSAILVFGFVAFGLLQIVCYIDYLVEIGRCQIYSRLVSIFYSFEHLTFDIYQMQRILPLVGTIFDNPKPFKVASWIFFLIRLGCFIAEIIVQNPMVAPPLGGFRTPGYGICFNSVNRISRELLISIKVGSFSFEVLLFAELVYIIYLSKVKNRRNKIALNSTSLDAVGRLLDFELVLFAVYFLLDAFFLIMFLVPNAGFVYAVSAVLYNAVLPIIVIANLLAIRWARGRRAPPPDLPPSRSNNQATTPTQRDSQSYELSSAYEYRYINSSLIQSKTPSPVANSIVLIRSRYSP